MDDTLVQFMSQDMRCFDKKVIQVILFTDISPKKMIMEVITQHKINGFVIELKLGNLILIETNCFNEEQILKFYEIFDINKVNAKVISFISFVPSISLPILKNFTLHENVKLIGSQNPDKKALCSSLKGIVLLLQEIRTSLIINSDHTVNEIKLSKELFFLTLNSDEIMSTEILLRCSNYQVIDKNIDSEFKEVFLLH